MFRIAAPNVAEQRPTPPAQPREDRLPAASAAAGTDASAKSHPARRLPAESHSGPDRAENSSARGTVFIVEDDDLVRSLFRRILERQGFVVLEAGDGKSAVDLAEQYTQPIHLLIADINLPVCNGLEVARRLNALHPETRVLIVSGYAEDAMDETAAAQSTYPLLLKPFNADTFLERVSTILGRG